MTTPIERLVAFEERPHRRPLLSVVPRVLALACGAALLWLSTPRVIAALYGASATPVIERLNGRDAEPVSTPDLLAAQHALVLSLAWVPDGTGWVDLARIDLVLATRTIRAGRGAAAELDQAVGAARAGLALAPAQARGWLILAEATMMGGGSPQDAAAYLVESMQASPHDLWLSPNRAALAMAVWPALDDKGKALAAAQIRMVATHRGVEVLARMAKSAGNPGPARDALANDPALRRSFEATYMRL